MEFTWFGRYNLMIKQNYRIDPNIQRVNFQTAAMLIVVYFITETPGTNFVMSFIINFRLHL